MAQLFGDWWRAQEDRAFLTSNGADGEEASQSVEGQTATHPPHSLPARLFLPTEKSFLGESGEAVSSQTHSTSGRLRKSSALLITLHSLSLRLEGEKSSAVTLQPSLNYLSVEP